MPIINPTRSITVYRPRNVFGYQLICRVRSISRHAEMMMQGEDVLTGFSGGKDIQLPRKCLPGDGQISMQADINVGNTIIYNGHCINRMQQCIIYEVFQSILQEYWTTGRFSSSRPAYHSPVNSIATMRSGHTGNRQMVDPGMLRVRNTAPVRTLPDCRAPTRSARVSPPRVA